MQFIYIGPSWANRSFDTPDDTDSEITSLIKEWNLEPINLSQCAFTNGMLLEKIKSFFNKNPYARSIPIVWLYAEPLTDSYRYGEPPVEEILEREDWWEIRKRVSNHILDDIAALGNPVALIGSHSDVPDCDHKNITVLHPSWQKFLAKETGGNLENGWGGDVAHRLIMSDQRIKPSHSIVDAIVDLFAHWHRLELHGVFQICHPNVRGNKIFAQAIESDVKNWLSKFH